MLRHISLLCLALLITLLAGDVARADDFHWPGWRGPQRDGWVADFQPPSQWPEKLSRIWQVNVGTGYGTPLLSGDRVFQHARQGEEEVVWCIDLDSGDVLWRQSHAVPFKMGGGGQRHGKGPKSCPVISDGRLFTMSITGILSAWDTETGELLWRSEYGTKFNRSHPYWGASTSPIVDGDRVIAHFGTDDDGTLAALDVKTGNVVWTQGNDGPDYSSPLLAEIDGVRQLIEWNQRALVGVDSKTGELLWQYPYPHVGTNQNMPTPVLHHGRILLGGENRGIRSLQPRFDGKTWTVKEHWHQQNVALDMSSAVIGNNRLFGFSHYDSGRLFCLDTDSGRVLWEGPPRTGQNVMFLSVPGHVVALIDDGELRIIKADGARYEKVASYRVSDRPTWAPPVLFGDQCLIKDHDTLTLWSLSGSAR